MNTPVGSLISTIISLCISLGIPILILFFLRDKQQDEERMNNIQSLITIYKWLIIISGVLLVIGLLGVIGIMSLAPALAVELGWNAALIINILGIVLVLIIYGALELFIALKLIKYIRIIIGDYRNNQVISNTTMHAITTIKHWILYSVYLALTMQVILSVYLHFIISNTLGDFVGYSINLPIDFSGTLAFGGIIQYIIIIFIELFYKKILEQNASLEALDIVEE